MQSKAQSGSALNHRRTGCEIVGGEPQGWTFCRKVGIAIRRDATPACGECRTTWDPSECVHVSVGLESRHLLGHLV